MNRQTYFFQNVSKSDLAEGMNRPGFVGQGKLGFKNLLNGLQNLIPAPPLLANASH
jgi:hypothetical protein